MKTSTILCSLVLALSCGIVVAEEPPKVDWDAKYEQLLESDAGVRQKIEDGQATKEDVIQWMKRTLSGKTKGSSKIPDVENTKTKDLSVFRMKLREFVDSGKLSKEDAAKLLSTVSQPGSEAVDLDALGKRLKAAVKSGEMTAALAVAAYKEAAQQAGKRGGKAKAGQSSAKGKAKSGRTNFYAVVVGRLKTKDVELGEFTMEVDHVSSMYGNRWVKDEIVGKKIKVTGVSGQFLDKLLQIRRGKTLKVRSGGYQAELNTLTFAHKFHVLEETTPFKAEDYGVPPDDFRGFEGVLQGTIVEVGGYQLLMTVGQVANVAKASKAAKPKGIQGKRVQVVGFYDQHRDAFSDLHVGDKIHLSVRHASPTHDAWTVTDVLEKIGQD